MNSEFLSSSVNETKEIAARLAKTLKRGDIVLLDGDLGAGKTMFTQGVVDELSGGKLSANSPTFVILNIYDTDPKIYHFDLYRVQDVFELEAIGIEEYLFGEGVCLVEWPNRAYELFKDERVISVKILKVDENLRKIIIER